MKKKRAILQFSYSDKLSTLMLWWKAFFMLPIWAYLILPFAGSIIAFSGNTALQITYFGVLIWSLIYFVEDILKRKIRVEDNLISHGFRLRELNKLLSIGTDYKGNDVLPRKITLTFAQGKSMSFNLSRINAPEYQRLLKHIESNYPQCQIDPVLNSLLSCKKIARKVLVDDSNKFIIEYRSGQMWRNMREAFFDTASPWLRFGPIIVAFFMAPVWLAGIYNFLYMPASKLQSSENAHTMLSKLITDTTSPIFTYTYKAGEVFYHLSAHPIALTISALILAYASAFALKALLRPNSLSIDANGLNLAITMAGNTLGLSQIKWPEVISVALDRSADGVAKIKFNLKDNKSFYLDLVAIQENDRPRLAKALERFAPGCTIASELSEAMLPHRERSYTEIWLQSLSSAPERNSSQALAPGQRLKDDQYKVIKRLGVGGQGTAYLCRDELNNCNIVLKETIVPAYADRNLKEQALKSFEKEAKILESLDSDGIVKLQDYFFEDHRGYIGLEHIDGQNLRQLIAEKGALSEESIRQLAGQMCQILAYLHKRSIIHRDFTPDNLMLTSDNKLKLIDFNVAQIQQVGTTGTIAGKHSYLPPEQFRGKATLQSDIYAMGATLQFLATGKEPEAITQSSPIEAGVKTSEEFDQIVRSCTALDLNKRFKTVVEVATSLGQQIDDNELADLANFAELAIGSAANAKSDEGVTIKIRETNKETIEA